MSDTSDTKVGEVGKNKVFGDESGFYFPKKTEFSVLHYSKLISPHGAQTQADLWELSHALPEQKMKPWELSHNLPKRKMKPWELSHDLPKRKVRLWELSHNLPEQKLRLWELSQAFANQKRACGSLIMPLNIAYRLCNIKIFSLFLT
jgi:hypothetical protein